VKSWKLLLILIGASTVTLAQTQLYQWTDEKGQMHYSETPPTTGKTKDGIQNLNDNSQPGIPLIFNDTPSKEPINKDTTITTLCKEIREANKDPQIMQLMKNNNQIEPMEKFIKEFCEPIGG
jgi:hypothetical protein